MRIVKLNENTKKDLQEDLLKRSLTAMVSTKMQF